MWQELRDYWLPLLLFAGSLLVAAALLIIVAGLPFVIEYLPKHPLPTLFAEDTTVRRISIAGAVGLVVTAFVFFRPNADVLRKRSPKKPTHDTMAGA